MTWLPERLPRRAEHDGLLFVPLTPALLQEDYAAVMHDIAMLRAWSGQDWPTPEFTAAEDLDDLVRHDREQQERVALTYSVLSDGVVQGCIYVHPFDRAWRTRGLEPPPGHGADVAVRGWLHHRQPADLIAATLAFLDGPPFAFPRRWWQTNDHCPAQLAACDALGLTDELTVAGTDRKWIMRAEPQDRAQR